MSISTRRRVGSNLVWTVFSVAGGRGLFFVTTIYLARVLGVENFGQFTLAQSVAGMFWLAVDLGINLYGIREIAKDKDRAQEIADPLIGLRITAGLVSFTALCMFVYLSRFSDTQKLMMLGCGFYLLANAPYTDWVFKGLEKFKYIAYGSLASGSFFLLGCVLLVRSKDDVLYASLGWSFSYLLSSGILLLVLRRMGYRIRPVVDIRKWVMHLKESIHFTVAGAVQVFYQFLPLLILNMYYTKHDLGLFAAPYQLVISLCAAGFLIPSSFYPVLSDYYRNDPARFRRAHQKLLLIMMAVGVPTGLVGAVFGDRIIGMLFGSKYNGSMDIFKVLILLFTARLMRFGYNMPLVASNHQRWQVMAGFAGVLTLAGSYAIFVRDHSLVGLAGCVVLAETALLVVMMAISGMTYMKRMQDA